MTLPKFDKGIFFRFLVSLLLAAAALGLFLYSRGTLGERAGTPPVAVGRLLGPIDREVDSLLSRFGVDPRSVRRKDFRIPNTELSRVERRVVIPVSALSIQMNVAFSAMVRRYGGRAVASENLAEGTVTIHLELGGYVIETIVLKSERQPARKERRSTARLPDRGSGRDPAAHTLAYT
jgi:hypothetical protein